MTSPSPSPLLRDVIDIPERTSDSDFVLKLTESVADVSATLRHYVLTDRLVGNFDEALGLIAQAVASGQSKGVYLHGSFGSGKSHFMAVLYALLRGEPAARALKDLETVLTKHDPQLAGKKILLVPFHMLGADSIEQRVLGGYAEYIRTLHPSAPIPAVHRAESLLDDARNLRARIGDAEFGGGLSSQNTTGPLAVGEDADGGDDEWGDTETWSTADLDAAFRARDVDDPLRRRLVSDLLSTWFANSFKDLREDADAFISLDPGLSEIAAHAKGLGYDAVVLFLDELILWLANAMGDHAFVAREVQKVTNFVEGGLGARQIPVVSFIARQRDLRELVGETATGAVQLGFLDTLNLASGRFDTITLEDRNLPLIANRRLLRPKDSEAAAKIDRAFEATTRLRGEVWDTMLGANSEIGADRDAFRLSYPFSPAFMDTLVYVSSALQRNRTALKLMRQLLINHRGELRLGQVVPLGDLWDVLTRGEDKPFTDELRVEFEAARKLYTRKLRPYLLDANDLDEDRLAAARRAAALGSPVDGVLAGKVRQFTADDRYAKTLLVSALAPSVPALRNLTVRRLSALNYGSLVSRVQGQEVGLVAKKVERWAGQFGEIKFVPGDDPAVGLELVDVEVDSILAAAARFDTAGTRRTLVKRLLAEELGVTVTNDAYCDRLDLVWKGSRRSAEVVFGSVKSREDLRDDQFAPLDPDAWRLVVDFPFSDTGDGAGDARARVVGLQNAGRRTVVWIPADLTPARLADLGTLAKLDALLGGGGHRFDSHATNLSPDDRQRARSILKSRYDALMTKTRTLLRSAYGLVSKDEADVTDYGDHLLALQIGLRPTLAAGASFADAVKLLVGDLLAQQYPGHFDLDPDGAGKAVTNAELRTVLDYVRRAAEAEGMSVEVAKPDRPVVRRIAPALRLGDMHEVRFALGREWVELLQRSAANARADGTPTLPAGELSVDRLRGWINKDRGLDEPVIGLIVATFAEQTDRAWYQHGGLIPPPELTSITKDLTLCEQPLPPAEEWAEAARRAAALFGVNTPALRRGRLVRTFVDAVAEQARKQWAPSNELVRALESHAEQLGLDPRTGAAVGASADAPGRLRTAWAARDLLGVLDVPRPGPELVGRLAHADLAGPPMRLLVSMTSASAVARAIDAAPWDTFTIVERLPEPHQIEARQVLGRLRAVAADDEGQATSLVAALSDARAAATVLLARATALPPTTDVPVGPPRVQPPVDSGARGMGSSTGLNGGAAKGSTTDVESIVDIGREQTRLPIGAGNGTGTTAVTSDSAPFDGSMTVRRQDLDEVHARLKKLLDQHGAIEIAWRPARQR